MDLGEASPQTCAHQGAYQQPSEGPQKKAPGLPQSTVERRKKGKGFLVVLVSALVVLLGLLSYGFIKYQNNKNAKADLAAEAKACSDEMTPAITSLSDLDARLNVGIVEADYTKAVQDAEVAWSHADTSALSARCASDVETHVKAALAEYTQAATTWNNCITDTYCDSTTSSFNAKLSAHWVVATTEIQDAKKGLAAIQSNSN